MQNLIDDAKPGGSVFLIGMMGSGKTTLGKRLARESHREFIDLDREIERRNGVSVATIFEIEGESGFRLRESQLLDELCREPGLVIATGGDNESWFAAQLVEQLRFPQPETGFAFDLENRRHRNTIASLDFAVEIDEFPMTFPGQALAQGCLARPHHADEEYRAPRLRVVNQILQTQRFLGITGSFISSPAHCR